jgi:hypothetical protein
MRVPRTVQRLPRYVRRKWLKGQAWAYFFEPPTWARKDGCPVAAEALGSDYENARDKAESVLPLFDSWRSGGLLDVVPQRALPGTFDWLVKVFKEHRTWSEIDRKTRRMYEQGLNLVADHILKDGTRVGSKLLLSFTRGFVDALYAKILVVEAADPEGRTIKRERRRYANAAMTSSRRAWFVGIRAQEKLVPTTNHSRIWVLKHVRLANRDAKLRPQLGTNLLRSEARLSSWVTGPSPLPLSRLGNGCNVRNTSLERLRSNPTGRLSGLTACMSSIRRRVRKLGGPCLTKQNDHSSPN